MVNVTNWSAVTNFDTLLVEANRFSPFWLGILMMLWVVLVVTFLPYGFSSAILGGSFIAFLLGILLAYMELVAWGWVLMILGVVILMIIVDALFGKKE